MAKSSLLYKQYFDLKDENKGYLLFFKLGNYSNVYGMDAISIGALFGLVTTKRDGVTECCVNNRDFNKYKDLLIDKGISVAIAEKKSNSPNFIYVVTQKFDGKKIEVNNV